VTRQCLDLRNVQTGSGVTQPLVQWVPVAPYSDKSVGGVKETTRVNRVLS